MATWKDFATKSANWLTDSLIVSPLTSLYRMQNEAFKEQLEEQKAKAQAAPKPPAPKPPAPKPSPTPSTGKRDALVRIAQDVSNSYRRGSLSRPKFYHDGKVVAR